MPMSEQPRSLAMQGIDPALDSVRAESSLVHWDMQDYQQRSRTLSPDEHLLIVIN